MALWAVMAMMEARKFIVAGVVVRWYAKPGIAAAAAMGPGVAAGIAVGLYKLNAAYP